MKLQVLREAVDRNFLGLSTHEGKDLITIDEIVQSRTWHGDLRCAGMDLNSFEFSPKAIARSFDCSRNKFSSFEHFPAEVGKDVGLSSNKFTTLHDIHKFVKRINGYIVLTDNNITECMLGLLMIDGLMGIDVDANKSNKDFLNASEIINTYLPNTDGRKGVVECQRELIEAGLEEFAKL
jgi:hypothetical protein